ncbi:hypothetical protein OROMI_014340 [Orobanche minor]
MQQLAIWCVRHHSSKLVMELCASASIGSEFIRGYLAKS